MFMNAGRESGAVDSGLLHRPLGGRTLVWTTAINWGHFDTRGIRLTDDVQIVERFTPREDASELAYEISVIDPATFSEPVVMDKVWVWLPDVQIEPYECDAG